MHSEERRKQSQSLLVSRLLVGGVVNQMNQCSECMFYIGIDLKKASKIFAQHFSCGSSVTGDDEIVIQGDICYDTVDFIQQKWPEV